MTVIRLRYALSALVVFWTGSAFAAHVYVQPATGSGVSSPDLQTTTELVQTAVPEVSADDVVSQPSQADFVLQPHLLRLGQAYVLSISKVRNGQVVYSTQLKAEKMDELDKVAGRVTRSAIEGERAPSNPRVGEITDQEAKDGTQRRPVRKAAYLGFGGVSLKNLNSTGIGFSVAGAYSWDVNVARIKLMGEGDINGNAFFASGGLGGDYFLSETDVAPYIGADFGAGAAKIDDSLVSGQTIGGFVFGFGAGVDFLRTSAVNLDLGIHAAFLAHDNHLGMPQAVALRLGLYF